MLECLNHTFSVPYALIILCTDVYVTKFGKVTSFKYSQKLKIGTAKSLCHIIPKTVKTAVLSSLFGLYRSLDLATVSNRV